MTRKILGCILAMAMLFACGSFSLAEGEGTPIIKMTAVLHPNTQNLRSFRYISKYRKRPALT